MLSSDFQGTERENSMVDKAGWLRAWAMPLLLSAGILAGCASPGTHNDQPVLYPNAAYKAMGEAAARQQLDQCVALARQSGLQPSSNAAASGAMSERPNSTYRQFVQRCASEKGLDVIGWN
jgi:hypothetical protein